MVILFIESCFGLLSSVIDSDSTLLVKNAGLLGAGSGTVSLRSMEIISEVVGRSVALSCTHKSAT